MVILEILYFVVFITVLNLITGFKKSNVFGCGLVGFSGTGSFDINVIRVLLWHNSLTRGKHATGIFNPSTGIIKDAKEAKDFFKSNDMKKLKIGDNVLMGHVRHATVGNLADPNSAHPWDFGENIMMHNGTLKNYEELAKQYDIKKEEYTVDSQVLGIALQKNIQENSAFKVLSEYVGAAAVIMYNKKLETLFVYRDTERPLFYGYLNDTEMYISSLEDILEVVGCTGIKSFAPFKVHQIKEGKIITKMHVKRRTATKNTIIGRVVDCIKQIIEYTLYSSNKITLSDNDFTGFDSKIIKSKYLENYIFRSIVHTGDKTDLAKLTKDKFYKISKIVDDKWIEVIDDNKQIKKANVHMFDIRNFIPIKGSYVIPVVDVTHAKGDFKKDELYEVLAFTYGQDNIILRNHTTDNNISVALNNVRKASDDEVKKYFKNNSESNTCSINFTNAVKVSDRDDIVTLDKKNTDIEDAVIVDEDTPVDAALDNDSVINLLFDNQHTALKLITNAVTDIQSNFFKRPNLETHLELLKLRIFASKCTDAESNFMYNINENSYKNLDIDHVK